MIALIADRDILVPMSRTSPASIPSNLVVRQVEAEVVLALKAAAAHHGRSAEAEHREILRSALLRPRRRPMGQVLAEMPLVGRDEDFSRCPD